MQKQIEEALKPLKEKLKFVDYMRFKELAYED